MNKENGQRMSPIRLAVNITFIVAILLASALVIFLTAGSLYPLADLEHSLSELFDDLPLLTRFNNLLPIVGQSYERDGIFISENQLMRNVSPPNPDALADQSAELYSIMENSGTSVYFTVIPTACAIKQQEVPTLAPLFNQKQFITDMLTEFSDVSSIVDVYPSLFAANDQYTYYRTHSGLTGLGGYYVYLSLSNRLGFTTRPLSQFDITHSMSDFYGDLSVELDYYNLSPDVVVMYEYSLFDRFYRVVHTEEDGEQRMYNTLFPYHSQNYGAPTDIVLGAPSPQIDIYASYPKGQNCLIVADETVLSYIPFLMVHYNHITIVDYEHLHLLENGDITPADYDQMIVALSVETLTGE